MIVGEEPLRGFMAVETVGKACSNTTSERVRVQAALGGQTPEQVDDTVRRYESCSHCFFAEKETPEDLPKDAGLPAGPRPALLRPVHLHAGGGRYQPGQAVEVGRFPGAGVYGAVSQMTTAGQNQYPAQLINRYPPHRAS